MPSFIKADTHITLVFDDGDSVTIYNTEVNFGEVCKAVLNKNWELAKTLSQPMEAVKKSIKGIDKVEIKNGFVTYDDVPLDNSLTQRILEMHQQGYDISPMAIFLENLMKNTSYRAVNELYGFLESSELPITEDGHFLAYKRVDEKLKDIYTHTFDNSPGAVVEMNRNEVDEDKNRTCSKGLHFCARSYLSVYGTYASNKVIMIKINPADVVSIPTDYDNAKGRCCKYTVVKEMPIEENSSEQYPIEKLETPFQDSRTVVSEHAVELVNLAEQLLDEDEPTVITLYESATDAMHDTGIDSSSITKVCSGERRSAGGCGWRWAYENPLNRLEEETIIADEFDDDYDDDYYDEYNYDEED